MTPAQAITRHFGGEWNGSQGAFPTPGHSPSDRGVTVKDAAGGDVVFYCHNDSQFDWQGMKDDCRRLGLLPDRQRSSEDNQRRITGIYEYTDADGCVAYRTVRIEQVGKRKAFRAQRPDGRGGWLSGLDTSAPRILYRLPEILSADPASIVYLTEGERKADKLASWGFVATAIAFGAKGWRDCYATVLADRNVVILPDNDDEGRGFADRAGKSIAAAGGRVFVLPLPDLPPKGDIIDWNGTPEALRALTASLIDKPGDMLPLIDPGAWEGSIAPARAWALNDWIPARQASYLTGAGSTGKSLLSQQLATCIALGRPFLGVETRQSVAIYLTCEDDVDELHRRQMAICAALGISPRDLSGRLHLVSLSGAIGNELATFDPQGRMVTTKAWATLRATVMQTRAGFVVLDNVAHLFAGNENIRNQVAAFCSLLNGLAADANASVLFIGHPNKAGDSFSGSTAWENQVRSRLFLDRPAEGEDGPSDPDARTLSRAKANYARTGDTLDFRWHQWAFVQESDLPPNLHAELAANAKAAADNERFLRCLAKATAEKRAVSPNRTAMNYAPREFAKMPTGGGASEKSFDAAMNRLLHLGTIENGVRVYQRANRSWATGLGLAQTLAQTPAQTPAHGRTNPPAYPEADMHKPARTHPPIYKYIEAAPEAAAPFDDFDEEMAP